MQLRRTACSAAVGWNVLFMTVRSVWCNVWFKSDISLLICSLDDLSIAQSGLLKSPTVIVLWSVSSDLLVSASDS